MRLWCILVSLMLFVSVQLCASDFYIIHSNDRHGYIEARQDIDTGKSVSGMDVEATMIKQIRSMALREGTPCLLVDAGDIFQGTPVVNETLGEVMITLLNKLGYHFITFGNHEFDYGWQILKERMAQSRFLWLSSTVDAPALRDGFAPYLTFDVDGQKVAFLGTTTTMTPEKQLAKRIEGITFRDPITVLPPLIRRLKEDHKIKAFVLISHLGLYDDKLVAAQCPDLDLIIGGHSHSVLSEPEKVGKTWICQTGASSRYLGLVKVSLDSRGCISAVKSQLREVDRTLYLPDPEVSSIIKSYTVELDKKLAKRVGTASSDIAKGVAGSFAPMAQIAADSFRRAAGAEVGLMNTGGARRGILRGPVTLKDVQTAVPFRNYVVKLRLRGSQIYELIRTAVDGLWQEVPVDKIDLLKQRGVKDLRGLVPVPGRTGFLVGGGIRFVFDPRQPVGKRMQSFEINGKALEPDRIYTVGTNDFLADGGDGFVEFTKALSREDVGLLDAEAVRDFFLSRSVVHPPACSSAVNLSFPTVEAEKKLVANQ